MKHRVAIVGASAKPQRYSYKAMQMLLEYGHEVFLVHPKHTQIEKFRVYAQLSDLTQENISIVTLYVNPTISSGMRDALIALQPKGVIFNPGSENSDLIEALKKTNIQCVDACTLVLLKTQQFEDIFK